MDRNPDAPIETSPVERAFTRAHAAAAEWLERTVRQLKLELKNAAARERTREEQLEQSSAEAARLHRIVEGLQADIVRLRAELRSSQHEARDLHTRVADLERARVQAVEELDRARAENLDLRAAIDVYEKSRSWRFTEPLRSLRRQAGRLWSPSQEAPAEGHQASPDVMNTDAAAAAAPAAAETMVPDADQPADEPAGQRWDAPAAPAGDSVERAAANPDPPAASPSSAVPGAAPSSDYVALPLSTAVHTRIKLIAFYLPQFHAIPENDRWWGRGFTEWTNVMRGRPRFPGHYQPHLPGELGFYDLTTPGVQRRQIELARLHGIHGFCYHHYWFGGTTLLRRPLDQLLAHPELDFPFCLCWANENWTRRWDGGDDEVLIAQNHSPQDDLDFLRDIEPALRDRRYIHVGDRPVIVVYRPGWLPSAGATAERWRAYCREVGVGNPFLIASQAFDREDPRDFNFDAALEFPPNNMGVSPAVAGLPRPDSDFSGRLYDYRELVEASRSRPLPDGYTLFRGVMPMWDNDARRPARGTVFAHSSPDLYQQWLEDVCRWTERHGKMDEPFVFVNAWNEWAEGNHLEPDRRYGYAYLRATAAALGAFPPVGARYTGRDVHTRANASAEVL